MNTSLFLETPWGLAGARSSVARHHGGQELKHACHPGASSGSCL